MSARWNGPLTEARPPARPRPRPEWAPPLGTWLILGTLSWITLILIVLYVWSLLT